MPATGGQGADPGNTMLCHVSSDPGLPAALVASFGMRAPLQIALGAAWVDPSAHVVLRIGLTDAAGELGASIPIPAGFQRGFPITVQSLVAPSMTAPPALGAPAILPVL